jgi:5-formyltetrahydrofolate cyclo-ligase
MEAMPFGATYNSADLGMKQIEADVANLYFSLDKKEDKQRLLRQTLNKSYADLLPKMGEKQEQQLKIG